MNAFGQNIYNFRKKMGWTQGYFAKKISERMEKIKGGEFPYSNRSISKWEMGDGYPSLEVAIIVAQMIGVSLDELFSDKIDEFKTIDTETEKLNYTVEQARKLATAIDGIESVWIDEKGVARFQCARYNFYTIGYEGSTEKLVLYNVSKEKIGKYSQQSEIMNIQTETDEAVVPAPWGLDMIIESGGNCFSSFVKRINKIISKGEFYNARLYTGDVIEIGKTISVKDILNLLWEYREKFVNGLPEGVRLECSIIPLSTAFIMSTTYDFNCRINELSVLRGELGRIIGVQKTIENLENLIYPQTVYGTKSRYVTSRPEQAEREHIEFLIKQAEEEDRRYEEEMERLATLQEQEALERYESLTDEEKVIWNECYAELVEELKKCDIDTTRWSKSMFVDDCIRLMALRVQRKEKEYADEKQMCLYQYKIFGG